MGNFTNFTEETCTGTGATLELAGATSGNLTFSLSFSDGDFVAYALEEGGAGTQKIAGIGTYVSATDDITRNDLWNYNGTVTDDNPSSNITLNGDTHTIRCAPIGDFQFYQRRDPSILTSSARYFVPDNVLALDTTNIAPTADRLYYADVIFSAPTVIVSRVFNLHTIDAAATNLRLGIWRDDDVGRPGVLLDDSGDQSALLTSGTGLKTYTLSAPLFLAPGHYYFGWVTDSTVVRVGTGPNTRRPRSNAGLNVFAADRAETFFTNSVTGALTSNPTVSGSNNVSVNPTGYK